MTPRSTYTTLAFAEAVTWTLLIAGMIAKYGFGLDLATTIAGGLHGFVFLCYCVMTLAVGTDARWSGRLVLLGLGSAVIPYATIPFERHVDGRGMLPESWRLSNDTPRNPAERVLAFSVRRPVLAILIALVVVSIVFVTLLAAGPPYEWFD